MHCVAWLFEADSIIQRVIGDEIWVDTYEEHHCDCDRDIADTTSAEPDLTIHYNIEQSKADIHLLRPLDSAC